MVTGGVLKSLGYFENVLRGMMSDFVDKGCIMLISSLHIMLFLQGLKLESL